MGACASSNEAKMAIYYSTPGTCRNCRCLRLAIEPHLPKPCDSAELKEGSPDSYLEQKKVTLKVLRACGLADAVLDAMAHEAGICNDDILCNTQS